MRTKRWALHWLFCMLAACAGTGWAQQPDGIARTPRVELGPEARFLEDAAGDLTVEDVRGAAEGWSPLQRREPHFGFSRSAYWLSIPVVNDGRQALPRLLEVGYPLLDELAVWLYGADGRLLYHAETGDRRAFADRPLRHRHFVFPLTLPANEASILYVRVRSAGSLQVPLTLWEPAALQESSDRGLALLALYAGLMVGIIAYNLFLYFSVRLRAYLYYVLFMSCVGLLLMELRGVTYQFLWPNAGWWQQNGSAVLVSGMVVAGSLFTLSFLNIRQHSRLFSRLLHASIAAGSINIVLVPFVPFFLAVELALVITMAWICVLAGAGVAALRRGEKSARYFLLAWAALMISGFLTSLYQFGFTPKALAGDYILLIGSCLEALLLSFALADHINQMRDEKDLAQRESLNSLLQYQRLYQEARYGIFTTGPDDRVLGCNAAAARVLGYRSPRELCDSIYDFSTQLYVDPADRERLRQALATRGHIDDFEALMRRKNREPVWVSLSARLVADGPNRVVEGSLIDITERKRRERAERERELAEAEREAATLAAQTKSAFLSNMSHEIRTPLTAVIGYGEFLLEPSMSDTQRRELAQVVVRGGRHLLALINDILDLSKIESGQLELEKMPVDLVELLADVSSVFEVRARERGLRFTVDYRLPLPRRINSDPTRLKQILYNLCSNAVKFTPDGSVTIEVAWAAAAQRLRLAVIDTGVGIAADKQQRVFDAFAQADASTTRRYGGTGLGLSISLQLAQKLGGDIRLDSEPGRGSRFELTVPAVSVVDAPLIERLDQLCLSGPKAPQAVRPPRLRGRILYAEDAEESRRLLRMLIEPTGAELVTVDDGRQAVARAAAEPFDLVLMDIQMPTMDGFGALAALRRAGFDKPVVALTANVMDEDRARYAAAGFDACESKPIDRPALYRLLQRYLGAAEAPAGVPAGVLPPAVSGRVLLVEDHPVNRRLVEWHIRRSGAEAVAVASGEAALEAARAVGFDLVLMDRRLPGIDGVETVRRLRAAGCEAPIYMLSADTGEELRAQARAAGCQGYLDKPLEPARLYAVIVGHLRDADGAAQDDRDELETIRRAFVERLPHMLAQMRAGAEAGDWAAVAGLAHQLAGSGSSFGYLTLSERGRALERALKTGQPGEAPLAALRESIEAIVGEASPA